jgi:hypothetical protein
VAEARGVGVVKNVAAVSKAAASNAADDKPSWEDQGAR